MDDLIFHQLKRKNKRENFWYHKDEKGSVVALSDEKGKIRRKLPYDAR